MVKVTITIFETQNCDTAEYLRAKQDLWTIIPNWSIYIDIKTLGIYIIIGILVKIVLTHSGLPQFMKCQYLRD